MEGGFFIYLCFLEAFSRFSLQSFLRLKPNRKKGFPLQSGLGQSLPK
jgi:hypothetical protein